ncbi:hypothetical protein LEP1GSC133_3355 [Leptospira borgpetersenii serovar Pomona str. 200901868]|uniref:Uncharacterized protein n=1 Tax=Leptospira borgpetersenii serovar Pomona str. 200901868 TaxID=1192866 RepID=M6VX73_LEPBO|nr:hypothetical protein LEP1GSC133_3355 [Leptospira borgpetersenii serovar Pomona str. 200901868]
MESTKARKCDLRSFPFFVYSSLYDSFAESDFLFLPSKVPRFLFSTDQHSDE